MSSLTPERRDHRRPRERYGAHRSGRRLVAALMPSVLAVAAVAALITALAVWQGEQPDRVDQSAQPLAAASTSRQPSSAPAAQATETEASSTAPAPTGDETPADETTSSDQNPAVVVPDAEVVVLNQTSRGGLAGTVAETLREAGWEVPAVGNFRGVVPATTVYYPDGAQAEAMAVASDLPTEPRVRPRFGNLSASRLTVVVTDSFPG